MQEEKHYGFLMTPLVEILMVPRLLAIADVNTVFSDVCLTTSGCLHAQRQCSEYVAHACADTCTATRQDTCIYCRGIHRLLKPTGDCYRKRPFAVRRCNAGAAGAVRVPGPRQPERARVGVSACCSCLIRLPPFVLYLYSVKYQRMCCACHMRVPCCCLMATLLTML